MSTAIVDPTVLNRVVAALTQIPAGLLTDIDGTISKIAPTAEAARAEPAAVAALARLSERLALVAAISGRAAPDAAQLIGLPKMIYVGNHGLERHTAAGSRIDPQAIPYVPVVAAALAATERAADRSGLRGLVFENKGATASIHYRLAPDPAAMQARLTGLLAQLPETQGLRVNIGVAAPEAPADLAAMADALVEGVDGVSALLVAVADRLEAAAGSSHNPSRSADRQVGEL
jgi:trehalose 6-phosphate phosphatase